MTCEHPCVLVIWEYVIQEREFTDSVISSTCGDFRKERFANTKIKIERLIDMYSSEKDR